MKYSKVLTSLSALWVYIKMDLAKKLIKGYKKLSSFRQFGVVLGLSILLFSILPAFIVFILAIFAGVKLIKSKGLKVAAVFLLTIATFLSIGFALDQSDVADIEELETQPETEIIEEVAVEEKAEVEPAEKELQAEKEEPETESVTTTAPASSDTPERYAVTGVVDGDTVKLNINGTVETIRLIGIDTPETVHPSKPVECFGVEASNKAKELLTGQTVTLEADSSQGTRDKYNRLLGYIILPNGTNFNKLMIAEGYAYEYTYSIPYKYQTSFKAAEQAARDGKVGLWGDGVCDEVAEEETPQETGNEPVASSNSNWYVSSHYSSQYYYCEESDGWKGLSETYLRVFDSEAELQAEFPEHTLHESCW